MTPLLSNANYKPQPADIGYSSAAFQELLKIRYSSELFRIPTFEQVQQNLTFLNTGQSQTPGVIVMKLDSNGRNYGTYKHVVVIFNGTNAPLTFTDTRLSGLSLQLHPVQAGSADAATRASTLDGKQGTVKVAALTTAVFVSAKK